MSYFFTSLILFLSSILFTAAFIRYAKKKKLLDIPNDRSSHSKLTPRGGGIVFISLWLLVFFLGAVIQFFTWQQILILFPGVIIVALVGYLDDHFSLKASYRAIAYFCAALLMIVAVRGVSQLHITNNLFITLSWFTNVIAIFMLVWSTNLFNFMDGIDGIAAIEALFCLGIGGYFFWIMGGISFAAITWSLAIAVGGFLVWNFPAAKLFMGDVGSASLGFIIMALALIGEKYFNIPILLWFIVYGVFIVDASLTLLRRMWAKEAWYKPHCSHAYQRLHQLGWSHAKIIRRIIAINTLLALLSLFAFYHRNLILPVFLLAFALLFYLYYRVEKLRPMFLKNGG